MNWQAFVEAHEQLGPGEQERFATTVQRLLAEGIIWREMESDRDCYRFISQHSTLVADYLHIGGWELQHVDRVAVYHVIHLSGAHRYQLDMATTRWFFLLRLLYAEYLEQQQNTFSISLANYPSATIGEAQQRYQQVLGFPPTKDIMREALRFMQRRKLIQVRTPAALRTLDADEPIVLLPTLEVVLPGAEIAVVVARLEEYRRGIEGNDRMEGEGL